MLIYRTNSNALRVFQSRASPFAMARCQLVDWSNAERLIKEAFLAEQVLLELFEHLKYALRQQQGKSEGSLA